MAPLTMDGINLEEFKGLETQLKAWYKPGAKLMLDIGLSRDPDADELMAMEQYLTEKGMKLTAPLSIGSGAWEHQLRMQFENPKGFGFVVPLVVMIIGAIGILGLTGVGGWRITNIIEDHLPGLALMVLAGFMGWAYFSSKKTTTGVRT